jgi:hypothetical protein
VIGAAAPEPPLCVRVALSFACAFAGWLVGMVFFVAGDAMRSGPGVEDLEAVGTWSAMFAFAAWALAVVPLVRRLDPDGAAHRLSVAPVFGAVCGVASCTVLLVPFGATELIGTFGVQAAIVGAFAWTLHVALVGRWRWPAASPAAATWSCALAPFVAIALALASAPAVERLAPSWAWRFGPTAMRQRVLERTLHALRVGDPVEDLRRALPGHFDVETRCVTGQMGADLIYRIEFADGRVRAVDLRRR